MGPIAATAVPSVSSPFQPGVSRSPAVSLADFQTPYFPPHFHTHPSLPQEVFGATAPSQTLAPATTASAAPDLYNVSSSFGSQIQAKRLDNSIVVRRIASRWECLLKFTEFYSLRPT